MILARVTRVVQAAAQAQAVEQAAAEGAAEEHAAEEGHVEHAAEGAAEEAAQAAVAAARAELEEGVVRVDEVPANNMGGEPGFTISVAPPPRVTFVTTRLGSLSGNLSTDTYPYIVASGSFCLLAHFATAPNYGTDLRPLLAWRANLHHLVLVRYFRRAGGEIAATAVRVPDRPRAVPRLRNIESVGLVCDGYTGTRRQRTYNFRIAELIVDTGRNPSVQLAIFRSDRSYWFSTPPLKSPLVDWDAYRRWVPHGALAVHSTVMWFDLSWGILSCDVLSCDLEHEPEPEEFAVSPVSFYGSTVSHVIVFSGGAPPHMSSTPSAASR
jgi:hypothetical protein